MIKELVKDTLNEKESIDKIYRDKAVELFNKIHKFLKSEDLYKSLIKNTSAESLFLNIGTDIDPRYRFLYIAFAEDDFSHSYYRYKLAHIIKLSILKETYNIENIDERFYHRKDTFIHEFIHYLDKLRGAKGGRKASLSYAQGNEAGYYNSPVEFNAYYQEGVARIWDKVKSIQSMSQQARKKDIAKFFPKDFKQFLKKVIDIPISAREEFFDSYFIKNLNSTYRRKFIKRLSDLYKEVIKELYKDIDEQRLLDEDVEKMLTEKRRNPELNKKISAYEHLKKYSKDPDIYVSFTELPKIGIKPLSSYNTPNGIYTYPLKEIWNEIEYYKDASHVPFGGKRPYIFILKSKNRNFVEDMYSDYTSKDYDTDMDKLRKLYKDKLLKVIGNKLNNIDDLIIAATKIAKHHNPITSMWSVTMMLAMILPGKDSQNWNNILRSLGYSGFADKSGKGIIHGSEPMQAVFLSRDAFQVVDMILNKAYKAFLLSNEEVEWYNKTFPNKLDITNNPLVTEVYSFISILKDNGTDITKTDFKASHLEVYQKNAYIHDAIWNSGYVNNLHFFRSTIKGGTLENCKFYRKNNIQRAILRNCEFIWSREEITIDEKNVKMDSKTIDNWKKVNEIKESINHNNLLTEKEFKYKVQKVGKQFRDVGTIEPGGSPILTSKTKIVGRLKPETISINELDPGAVITFRYSGEYAHDPSPVILMLSDGPFENKVHGINVKYLPKPTINMLIDIIVNNGNEVYDPLTFYHSKIKPFLRRIQVANLNVYRAYLVNKMKNIKVYSVTPGDLKIHSS